MARPWKIVQGKIEDTLPLMADGTKDNIIATPAHLLPVAGGGTYAVAARIDNALGALQSTGQYQAQSGIHAEIEAINNLLGTLGGGGIPHNLVLLCSDNPCKRCAAIICAFRKDYGWTHKAIGRAFHSNYVGAYSLPDGVLDVVIAKLTAYGALETTEPVRYRSDIRSLIAGWG
jgi:Cytidine and deoxycytidylate deaminase zinc-binding region